MIKDLTRKIEDDFLKLFAKKIKISENLYRYVDKKVFDMYDHNFFVYNDNSTLKEIYDGQAFQYKNYDDFYKLVAYKPLKKKIQKAMQLSEDVLLTMVHDGKTDRFKINPQVTIKETNLKEFEALELKHYKKIYGEGFIKRRDLAYFKEANKNKHFKLFGAYLNDKLVGSCYCFFHEGFVLLDDLLVDNRHRKQYVASTILKYLYDTGYRMMLHADKDDYPYQIYKKYGFKIVDKSYEYFKKLYVIGDDVKTIIDRPLGTRHPEGKDIFYELNYGFVKDIISPDLEEQDTYIMDEDVPLKTYQGKLIAIVHRIDDLEDKWVLANKKHTDKEIEKAINFQEKYHKHYLIRKK